ncbi:2TM domain-containing protein [Flavobacterium sp. RNTU_13]|uniref:2TM domain-containing protein n=1 Tax=Flavobacterium sp. RNTU_13 TaxID=3375145 RepID=UPI003987EAE4
MNIYNEQEAYVRARKQVRELRGFYIGLAAYCVVIPILIIVNVTFSPEFHWFWFSLLGWGTALVIKGLKVFNLIPFMGRDWEERKMREYIAREEKNTVK